MIKYIQPLRPNLAQGTVADVYTQVMQDFGIISEYFLIHSPIPKLLSGIWMVCRETEIVGEVPRQFKEAIAAAISQTNGCSYCTDMHTIMLSSSGQKEAAIAIKKGQFEQISNNKLKLFTDWAKTTSSARSAMLNAQPYSRQQVPEIVGTAVFSHYINRMATILLCDTPLPSNQRWLKGPLKHFATNIFSKAISKSKKIGEAKFLFKTDLPNDLRWAKSAPNVADAYACFALAVEEAGEYALPAKVRSFVKEEIDEWRGETSALKLAWSEDAVSRLEAPLQAAAELALLTAVSPHDVKDEVVLDFKKHFPEEGKLIGALAWASFTAARKIGTWIGSPILLEHNKNFSDIKQQIK